MIEALESRIAPALLAPIVSKGILHIQHDAASGTTEDVTVTQVGPGTFAITDSLNDTFPNATGVKSIQIVEETSTDTITFSKDGLPGAVQATFTGGPNTFNLNSVNNTGAIVKGPVTILGGAGDDSVDLVAVTLGSTVKFIGGNGSDSFSPDATIVAGKVTLGSVENITTNGTSPVILGSLLVENDDQVSGAVTFVLSNVSTIRGALKYCGNNVQDDNVTLNGQYLGTVDLMLNEGTNNAMLSGDFHSSLLITGGAGADTISLQRTQIDFSMSPRYITAHVAGALTMKLGNGTNSVTFDGGSFFEQSVSLTGGTGTDTVNFTEFYMAKNLTLSLGNGANTINAPTGTAVSAAIAGTFKYTGGADIDTLDLNQLVTGHLAVSLGNGANKITGSIMAQSSVAIVTGNGADTVDIGLMGAASLSVKLGAGDDSFTYEGGSVSTASLDGGPGTDTITGSTLLPTIAKLKNFETVS